MEGWQKYIPRTVLISFLISKAFCLFGSRWDHEAHPSSLASDYFSDDGLNSQLFCHKRSLLCSTRTKKETFTFLKHWGDKALTSLRCLSNCFISGHFFKILDQIQLNNMKEKTLYVHKIDCSRCWVFVWYLVFFSVQVGLKVKVSAIFF